MRARTIYRLPMADYRALPGVHFSTLKTMDLSPLHYLHATKRADYSTSAMTLGTVVHSLVLTGHPPAGTVIWDGTRRGKAWDEFEAAHPDRIILRAAELGDAEAMRAAVLGHTEASALLSQGDHEVTVVWESHGMPCRGRVDWMRQGSIVELKTTRSIDPRIFMREIATRQYHAQLAFYTEGIALAFEREPPLCPFLIAVESAAPFDVCVYRVGADALEAGARKVAEWMRTLRACTDSDTWPGVDGGKAVDLRLPDWALADGDDVDMSGIGGE